MGSVPRPMNATSYSSPRRPPNRAQPGSPPSARCPQVVPPSPFSDADTAVPSRQVQKKKDDENTQLEWLPALYRQMEEETGVKRQTDPTIVKEVASKARGPIFALMQDMERIEMKVTELGSEREELKQSATISECRIKDLEAEREDLKQSATVSEGRMKELEAEKEGLKKSAIVSERRIKELEEFQRKNRDSASRGAENARLRVEQAELKAELDLVNKELTTTHTVIRRLRDDKKEYLQRVSRIGTEIQTDIGSLDEYIGKCSRKRARDNDSDDPKERRSRKEPGKQ